MVRDIKVENKQVTVTLSGELHVEEATELRNSLLEYIDRGYQHFLMDMAGVQYIDSSGLGVLITIHKRAVQNGGGVIVKNVTGMVKNLFNITRLNKVFEIQ